MSNTTETDGEKLKRILRQIAEMRLECNDGDLWHCRSVLSTIYQWLLYEDVNTAAVVDMIHTMEKHFYNLLEIYKGEWDSNDLAVRLVDLANEALAYGINVLGRMAPDASAARPLE